MDRNDTPCTLHAELFEECWSCHCRGAGEGVWIQQSTSNYADVDDREASAEALGEVSDNCAATYGSDIGDYLRDGDLVLIEPILVFKHGGIEVLRTMAHEVYIIISIQTVFAMISTLTEASHQAHHVDKDGPMLRQSSLSFLDESLANVTAGSSYTLPLLECLCLGEAQAKYDQQDRRTSAEPV